MTGGARAAKYVFFLVALLTGTYYLWGVRAAGYPFQWEKDQPGYYNYLGRAFAAGHLYLPVEPSPLLLAQPDPWDPKTDDSLKLFDAVLFNRRYYLYHGAGPAVLLFAPYRLLTHRDLPENFALFLFCFGGFLFSGGALLELLRLAGVQCRAPLLALLLVALGFCQGVPFLLSRVWVYEVAVGGGYFCLAAAVFCLLRSWPSSNGRGLLWGSAGGLMFGLAVACRPHLAIAGAVAGLLIAVAGTRKQFLAYCVPLLLVGACIATYNFARFGNPVEFGNSWILSGANQGKLHLSPANVLPGLYYMLFARPVFSPVFPWVELPWPPRDFARPAGYILEQTLGALWLAPFLIALPLLFFARRNRTRLVLMVAAATGILLFVTMTGWSTQRYEVDFLPLLVLATVAACAEVLATAGGLWGGLLKGVSGALIVCGCVVNLALGVSGPYWEMIRNKPLRFVKIAGWFSPVARYRPVLQPTLDVSFLVVIKAGPDHVREPWVTAARYPWQYELYVEHVSGKPVLFSGYADSVMTVAMQEGPPGTVYRVHYTGPDGDMTVSRGGVEILRHRIGPLVTAPSQILVRAGN